MPPHPHLHSPQVSEYVEYVLSKNKRPGEDRLVDELSGTAKTVDEEAYDFFKVQHLGVWKGTCGLS
eukprot:364101-Chlamydomonas_euryale.AAC.2